MAIDGTRGTRRVLQFLVVAGMVTLTTLLSGGCASLGVHPWERDLLAEPAMSLDGDHVSAALDAHIYFSKEASTGGPGLGGGGCGCN